MRFISLLLFYIISIESFDTSRELLMRKKRYLIWNEGINWVQMIVGIGLPIELRDQSITVGTVVKAYYLLPTNSSDYTHPMIVYERRKRSNTRWLLYDYIADFLERLGHEDGKACLLKSICEIAHTPLDVKTGILAEIIHALLKPSLTNDTIRSISDMDYYSAEMGGRKGVNCTTIYSECTTSILEQYTTFMS